MNQHQIKELTEINNEYRTYSITKKQELAYLLTKEGYMKANSPLLRVWWQNEKMFHPHYSVIKAMDNFIEDHPEVLYLDDFYPKDLGKYPTMGEKRIEDMEQRKKKGLIKFQEKNGDK